MITLYRTHYNNTKQIVTIIGPHITHYMQNATAEKFDQWAHNGKAEEMEKGHSKSVTKILQSAKFGKKEFTFLDIGCGNGWVVRTVALSQQIKCTYGVGIDKSAEMIKRAKSHPNNTGIEKYYCADIEQWSYKGQKFDYVFAMESIYYADSVKNALNKVHTLLKPGGIFLCGTDFYAENTATKRWSALMNITMHLYSKNEWRKLFTDAGFKTRLRHIKDKTAKELWKQNMGTLFITGQKSA